MKTLYNAIRHFFNALIFRDRESRFKMLTTFGGLIMPEYRFKWPHMMWWRNPDFCTVVDDFDGRGSVNYDRRWMMLQLMRLVDDVEGDTAECGCYKGCGSYLICDIGERQDTKRSHLIFDSFEGLSDPAESDGDYWTRGDLAAGEEAVKDNLSRFSNVLYFRGWIPERFPEVEERVFSFVHIDVDLEQPTIDSFTFFYERMSDGGIILCDDYGLDTCPGATSSIDEFLQDKEEKMLALSGGSGFIIKSKKVTPYNNFSGDSGT